MNYTGQTYTGSYTWAPTQTQQETERVETLEYDSSGKLVKKTVVTKYRNQPNQPYPSYPQVWCGV